MMENLARFPASAFGMSLGTVGQAALWQVLGEGNSTRTGPLSVLSKAPAQLNQLFWTFSLVLFSLVFIVYLLKVIKHWSSVVREFRSSVNMNFFFMPLLTMMVLGNHAPTQWFSESSGVLPLLYVTVLPLLAFEVYLYAEWMYGVTRSLAWANPAYQLAIVGNIIGSQLASKAGQPQVAIFLLAVGIFYWAVTVFALHTVRDEIAWLGRGEKNSARQLTSRPPSRNTADIHTDITDFGGVEDDAPLTRNMSPVATNTQETDADGSSTSVPFQAEERNDQSPTSDVRLFATNSSKQGQATQMGLCVVETQNLNIWSRKTPVWSLPEVLQPTLFLYTAPPSLLATSLLALQGHCSLVCQSSASLGFFFFLVNVAHIPRFFFHTPFSLAVWVFTFPSSALAAALVAFSDSISSSLVSGLATTLSILSIFFYASALSTTIFYTCRRGFDAILLPWSSVVDDQGTLHYLRSTPTSE